MIISKNGHPSNEWKLLAVSWRDQAALVKAADEWGLNHADFEDPVCRHGIGYLRVAHDLGMTPNLPDAVGFIAKRTSLPPAWVDCELYERLQCPRPEDASITDLVKAVTEDHDANTAADLRIYLKETKEAYERALKDYRYGRPLCACCGRTMGLDDSVWPRRNPTVDRHPFGPLYRHEEAIA